MDVYSQAMYMHCWARRTDNRMPLRVRECEWWEEPYVGVALPMR